mmetsp:Transcript_3230/g.4343  ORF Transcript_3230/g.4343 Transcript_3230/m.4343 type:complete len:127 (-) Transcript_3230:31-411(-)
MNSFIESQLMLTTDDVQYVKHSARLIEQQENKYAKHFYKQIRELSYILATAELLVQLLLVYHTIVDIHMLIIIMYGNTTRGFAPKNRSEHFFTSFHFVEPRFPGPCCFLFIFHSIAFIVRKVVRRI